MVAVQDQANSILFWAVRHPIGERQLRVLVDLLVGKSFSVLLPAVGLLTFASANRSDLQQLELGRYIERNLWLDLGHGELAVELHGACAGGD